jgi:hypothetical protein
VPNSDTLQRQKRAEKAWQSETTEMLEETRNTPKNFGGETENCSR